MICLDKKGIKRLLNSCKIQPTNSKMFSIKYADGQVENLLCDNRVALYVYITKKELEGRIISAVYELSHKGREEIKYNDNTTYKDVHQQVNFVAQRVAI